MGVSKNNGTPNSSNFNRVFHYFNHPFWGPTPILGNIHLNHRSNHGPLLFIAHLYKPKRNPRMPKGIPGCPYRWWRYDVHTWPTIDPAWCHQPSGGNSWWGVVKNARKVGLNKSGGFSNSTVLSDFFCDFELVELGLCSLHTNIGCGCFQK